MFRFALYERKTKHKRDYRAAAGYSRLQALKEYLTNDSGPGTMPGPCSNEKEIGCQSGPRQSVGCDVGGDARPGLAVLMVALRAATMVDCVPKRC